MNYDRSGSLLSGRFYLKKRISEGGSGEIYLAEDRNCGDLQKKWVVKWVDRKKNGPWFDYFKNEVRILESLHHPNMSSIHYYEENEDGFFMVIDHVEGETAKEVLNREGTIPEERALRWMRTVCSVLSYLHTKGDEPVIHADLNPANLMISYEDTVYLLDYGISRGLSDQERCLTFGTRGFAAPEQYADGSGKIDERTDIYGVGATLFNLLTGQIPLYTEHPRKSCSEITMATDKLVSKCLQKNPKRRFQNMQELIEEIESVLVNWNGGEQAKRQHQAMKILFILAFISLISAVCSGMILFRESQESARILELSGDEKVSKGDRKGAERDYFLSLETFPAQPEIYEKLYRLMRETNPFDEVCESFKDRTDYRYFNPEFALRISMHCFEEETGQYSIYAKALLKQAVRRGNQREKALAEALMPFLKTDISQNETEKILKTFMSLCEEDTNQSELLYFLLRVSERLHLSDETYDQILLKMESTLKTTDEFYDIVSLYHLLMDYYYQKAQRIPEIKKASLEKAAFYSRKTEIFDAVYDEPEQVILRGRIYTELGRIEEAEKILNRALQQDYSNRLILIELIRITVDRDVKKASDYFKRLTNLGKDGLSENLLNQINSLGTLLEMRGR